MPRIGSSHHCPTMLSIDGDRDAEREAEDEPEADHQVELALPEVAEDPHHQRRVLPEVVDDHDLGVEQLVDVLADLVGDPRDHGRDLALDPLHDRVAHRAGQVAPQPRVLLAHHLVDERGDLGAEAGDDVLGDPLGLELLVEVRGRAQLRDRLVDGDAAHLGRPRRDDALPADAALQEAGDLLQRARQHGGELAQAGDAYAVEAHRAEQHPQTRPVDQEADDAGEQRDGQHVDPVEVVPPRDHRVGGAVQAQPVHEPPHPPATARDTADPSGQGSGTRPPQGEERDAGRAHHGHNGPDQAPGSSPRVRRCATTSLPAPVARWDERPGPPA